MNVSKGNRKGNRERGVRPLISHGQSKIDILAGKRAGETPKSPVYPVVISTIGRNLNSTQ